MATPDKQYFVQLPGFESGEMWDAAKFERNKDSLYKDHSDAQVYDVTTPAVNDEIKNGDLFDIKLPGYDAGETWDYKKYKRNRDKLLADHPDVQIQRKRPITNWNPKMAAGSLNDIFDRIGKVDQELAGIKDGEASAADLRNMSDEDLVNAAAASQSVDAKRRRELKKEKERLLAEQDRNPVWREYWEKTISNIDDSVSNVDKMRSDLDKANPKSRSVSKFSGLTDRSGLSEMDLRRDIQDNPEYYRDQEALAAAKMFYSDAKKIAAAPSKYGDESGLANYWKGITDNAADALSVVALAKAMGNLPLIDAVKKIQEHEGKDVSITNIFNNPSADLSYLSDAQKELVNAFVTRAKVESWRSENLSRGYQSGKGAIQSVGFMADFLLMGGAGEDVANRLAIDKLVEKTAESSLARIGAESLYGLVKGTVMTPLMPSSYANVLNQITQLDDQGRMDLSAKAIRKAGEDAWVETVSEMIGAKPLEVLGWGAGKALPTDWITKTKFGSVAKVLRDNMVFKTLKQAGYNGFFEEMFEEVSGNAARVAMNLDKDALKNFFSKDELLITAASFAPMSVLGGIGSTARYGYVKSKYKSSLEDITKELKDLGFSDEQIAHITDLGRMSTPEDVKKSLEPVVDAMAERGATEKDVKGLLDYAYYASNMNLYKAYEGEKVKEQRDLVKGQLTEAYGDFWQGNEKTGQTVQRVTLPDGRTGYAISTDSEGETIVNLDGGGIAYIHEGDGAQVTTQTMDQYLDGIILAREQEEDEAEMQEEARNAQQQFNDNIANKTPVPMGTIENPVVGELLTTIDKNTGQEVPVRQGDGSYVVVTPDGVQNLVSEQDLAKKWGISQPKSKAQKDADATAEYSAAKQRQETYNKIPRGTTVKASLEGEDEPVEYKFTRAVYDEEDQTLKIYYEDENGKKEDWLPESAFPGLEQTAAAYVQESEKKDEVVKAADNELGLDGTPVVRRDSKGKELPMNEDGTVNEAELWDKDPEAWAAWNDSRRKDGGANSVGYVQAAVNQLQAKIDAAQKAYATELDFDKRKAMEQEIAENGQRLEKLKSILEGYKSRAEAAKKAAEQTPAEAVETPVEAAETPAEAELTPEQKAAAEEERRRIPLRERAKSWAAKTGVEVELLESVDDVTTKGAREEIERERKERKKKNRVTGWYEETTVDGKKVGKVYLYLPNIVDEEEIDKTYIHEVISHKGLKEMLDGLFNRFLDQVWKDLMDEDARKRYTDYILRTNPNVSGEDLQRKAADEFVAFFSENVDVEDQTLWDKFVKMVRQFFVELLGKENFKLTEEDVSDLLRASLARYKAIAANGEESATLFRVKDIKRKIENGVGGGIEMSEDGDNPVRFSIRSIADGTGLSVIEDDGKGNVAFQTADGRVFDAENHITPEDLKNLPDTSIGYMMEDALGIGTITQQQADNIWKMYADILNMMLDRGVMVNGIPGSEMLKSLWEWNVENTVYKSVSENADSQYAYSIDITRVCKKNEAVIKAISAMQSRVGYGITPGQIMDIYIAGIEEGYQVPCPVCYVFSRYINNGITATIAINGQKKYGDKLVDPSTLSEQERKRRIRYWVNELNKQAMLNNANAKSITKAKEDVARIIQEINVISAQVTSGELKGKERDAAIKKVRRLDRRYRAAFNVVAQSNLGQWIKQFAISGAKEKDGKYTVDGVELYGDTFQGFPEEYALDLRLTAETIEKYPAIQRMRKARGSAGGKEIHFASNNEIGEVPMMLGASNLAKTQNYYKLAATETNPNEKDKFRKKAKERFADAHRYAQQQSLRGGQRMWSWSDNIERLAPDVAMNLMQMQLLGGAIQSYSKQLEGVNLVASMGGYVNGSVMGYGKGYQELNEEDIQVVDGKEVLAHDITDTVTENTPEGPKERTRFLAKAGSPVFQIGGQKVTLLFDDIVGIDVYGRDTENGHLKGLFELNATLDKAGNIVVGMNDTHVRAAMADDRIFIIIPWHSSGNSVHIVQQMLSYLGVETDIKDYTDYTDVQEEKDMEGKEVSEYLVAFWENHKNETDFPCGIEGGIPSDDGNGHLSKEQMHYRELRDAIFLGTLEEHPEWLEEILNDEFLSQVYDMVNTRVDAGEMTKKDTGSFYSYEYWDMNSTFDTADVNGARYLEYCRRLGYKPDFVGKLDGKPESDHGNFADDKGYWKLLIDRRMYDVNGAFQALDPTTTDGFSPEMVDPEWTKQNFQVTRVADDPGAERLAERVVEKEGETLPGGVPVADYDTNLTSALRKYEAVLAEDKVIEDAEKKAAKLTAKQKEKGKKMLADIVESIGKKAEQEQGRHPEISESMVRTPRETVSQIRFRVSNADERIFISNAEKAVEDMKMDKATPEQWKKTLEKNGGLKAAEDKWLGLSDWLDGLDRKTVTKQEVLDFIQENEIIIEEQHYAEDKEDSDMQALQSYQQELDDLAAENDGDYEAAYDAMIDRYGDDFGTAFTLTGRGPNAVLEPNMDWNDDLDPAAQHFLDQRGNNDVRRINSTRLHYTTEGLRNRQEIALTVPTIESWNESDNIHFGDAGEGRAISWARFGDTETGEEDAEKRYREGQKAFEDYQKELQSKYQEEGNRTFDGWFNKATKEEQDKFWGLHRADSQLYDDWKKGRYPKNRVLVIDEIQSKRHQEAREQGGYKDDSALKKAQARLDAAKKAVEDYANERYKQYGEENTLGWTREEKEEYNRLYREYRDAQNIVSRNGFDPMEDEEYRRLKAEQEAYENSPEFRGLMDEWRRVVNEGGEDQQRRLEEVNDKLKPLQRRNQELLQKMQHRENELAEEFNATHKSHIPVAPFEKNWPELTMKRMLRYAAENGYDTMAWTTGEQQAERYNLGDVLNSLKSDGWRADDEVTPGEGETKYVYGELHDGGEFQLIVNRDGVILSDINDAYTGRNLSEVVGKEAAVKLLSDGEQTLEGASLRIGTEGMKGFYDDILVRFMNKYGKKWGVKVEDIFLPNIGDDAAAGIAKGLTMHSVKVTPEMKESVKSGQLMFRRAMYEEEKDEVDKITVFHGSGANFDRFDHSHMGEGEGAQMIGYGTYVTTNPNTGKEYAERFAKNGERHLYTVEIPKDNGENYLHWDKPITRSQSRKIMDAVSKIADKDMWGSEFDNELKSVLGYGTYGRHVDAGLNYFLGDEKNYATGEDPGAKRNSDLLKSVGIVGMEYPFQRANYDETHYVIYDESDLEIKENLRFRITPEQDQEYMDAVNAGNMEKADRMVREAAAAAMPDTVVVDSDGLPKKVLHGTNAEFNTFDEKKIGSATDPGWLGRGFYFYGNNPEYASQYGKRVISAYLNITDPYYADSEDIRVLAAFNSEEVSNSFRQEKEDDGYDGVNYNGDLNDEWVAFYPNQIKSADPVTYDDNGNVIPLSERFNPGNEDIRFRIGEDKKEALASAVPGEESPFKATDVTSAAGAKILKNLESFAKESENIGFRSKGSFLKDLGRRLEATEDGSNSLYATFEAKNGKEFTLRLSNHNAKVSNFDNRGEDRGISIVISRKGNDGILDDGNAYVDEYFYSDKDLRKSEDSPYSKIVRSVIQSLYSGEYKDTTGLAKHDEANGPLFRMAGYPVEDEESGVRFRRIEDQELIDRLDAEEKETGYQTVVQNPDGSMAAPMAGSLGVAKANKAEENATKTSPFGFEEWDQSEEHPELVDENGKIKLIKTDNAGRGLVNVDEVDYNPYNHLRLSPINTQFKDAWKRPDLIYIESEVPKSEVPDFRGVKDIDEKLAKSPYRADKAALPVGIHDWNGGPLMLSRYKKPKGQVPWNKLADMWAADEKIKSDGIRFDVVPPQILDMLVDRGIEITAPGKGNDKNEAYKAWKAGDKEAYEAWRDTGKAPKKLTETQKKALEFVNGESQKEESDDNIRFSIRGYNGVLNAEDYEAEDNLAVAEEMEKAGKDAVTIWRATGWERGVDNKWRNEIPDAKPKEGVVLKRTNRAGDILDAPDLFKSYPELERMPINVKKLPAGIGGVYRREGRYIELDRDYVTDPTENKNERRFKDNRFTTLLHELQHAIQHIEGFARGGSESSLENGYYREVSKKDFPLGAFAGFVSRRNGVGKLQSLGKQKVINALKRSDLSNFGEQDRKDIEALINHLENIGDSDYYDLVRRAAGVVREAKEARKNYERLAGEVEARNVETRNALSERGRKNYPLESSEDVSRHQQIVRFRIADRQEDESAKDFVSRASNEFEKTYGIPGKSPVISSAQSTEFGRYSPEYDRIVIFANDWLKTYDRYERGRFHETIHQAMANLGTDVDALYDKFVSRLSPEAVESNLEMLRGLGYQGEELKNEFITRYLESVASNGNADRLAPEIREVTDDIFKYFGYEPEIESRRRLEQGDAGDLGGRDEGTRGGEEIREEVSDRGGAEEPAGGREGTAGEGDEGVTLFRRAGEPGPTGEQLVKRVQEYGLRGVLEQEAVDGFYDTALRLMPEDMRREVIEKAMGDDLNIRRQVRKYVSELAGKGYAADETGLLRALADNLAAEIDTDQPLNENELLYMIWRGTNRYSKLATLEFAKDITMRRRLRVGEYTGEQFPNEVKESISEAENRIDEAETARDEARAATRKEVKKTPLAALNNAMSAQRKYDQATVDSIVALAKEMVDKKNNMDSISSREMKRLMTIIRDATGRRPSIVKDHTTQLLELMIDHTIGKEKEILEKVIKIKTAKKKEPGVDTIAKLDLHAQNVINTFRDNFKLTEAEIRQAISDLEDKLDDRRYSESSKEEMRSKLEGLNLALQYATEIASLEADNKAIRQQMKDAQDEFANLTAEEKKRFRPALNQELEACEEKMRDNKIDEVTAYRELRAAIANTISEGAERAKTFLEQERERINEIHHAANADLEGVDDNPIEPKTKGVRKLTNSALARLLFAPLANFDQLMRTLGRRHPEGRGYLWNRFMTQLRKASDNEKLGIDAADKKLNEKVREIFDDPKMDWNDLYSLERGMKKVPIRFFNANGEWVEEELTPGNMLYIYMVDKMADGRMKLRRMNIGEAEVAAIKKALDPRFIELADWIQEEFLPGLRDKYNDVHKRLFGTSMASIDNYFPLRILGGVIHEDIDLSNPENEALPSAMTGSIIKRKVNNKQLDITGTDAFSTVIEHIREMEHWAAYAEVNRDLGTLLSYKRFQNQVKHLNTIYGSGKNLWNTIRKTAVLAAGEYRPVHTAVDKAIVNLAKGVTAAKISFRAYTALKQILSYPAFLADTNPVELAKVTNPLTWKKNWDWAKENLPDFKKRVESRKAGNEILEDTDLDSKLWSKPIVKWINQNGMIMNAFVDALTVANGAKAVYETRKKQYLKEGFSEEQADEKAKMDATTAYNETQQSSGNEFLSTMQSDRTVGSVALSVYRNSSMGYQRQLHQGIRTLTRLATPGYKEKALEFTTKQLQREGLSEEDAKKAAEERYDKSFRNAAIRVAVFGFLVQFAWNLGSHAAYLLFGDDPDEKKAMLEEDATHALIGGSVEGLAGGNLISEFGNMIKNGENLRNWDPSTLPILSDIKSTASHMSSDPVAGVNELLYLAMQIGIGTNPQTLSDAVVGIVDACHGDFQTGKEVMLCIMRILAVPQSQLDQFMIDEIDMTAKDARELSYEDIAQRYVDYKMMRNAPVTGPAYKREPELEEKRRKALKTTFKKKVNEREKLKLPKEQIEEE